jgi:predicted dehydrogenase
VLVEKPLATTVEEAQAIVRAARGRLLMVGHLLRFDPRYLEARRRVAGGGLGEVLHAYARRNSAAGAVDRYGGTTSLPWHVSIHPGAPTKSSAPAAGLVGAAGDFVGWGLDLLRWVTGSEICSITALGTSRRFRAQGQLDSLQALLTLDCGASAVVESCWALRGHVSPAIDARLEVVGTEGMLEVSGFDQGLVVADRHGLGYPDTTRYAEHEDGAGGGILAAELAHFVRCIERGRPPVVDPHDALVAVGAAAATERAVRTGAAVRLDQKEV